MKKIYTLVQKWYYIGRTKNNMNIDNEKVGGCL